MMYEAMRYEREMESRRLKVAKGIAGLFLWIMMLIGYLFVLIGVLQEVTAIAACNEGIYSVAVLREGDEITLYHQEPGEATLKIMVGSRLSREDLDLPDAAMMRRISKEDEMRYLHTVVRRELEQEVEEAWSVESSMGKMWLKVYQFGCREMAVWMLVLTGNAWKCSLMEAQMIVFWTIVIATLAMGLLLLWWAHRKERYHDYNFVDRRIWR